mgnify:CR=1 FL=1
MKNVKNLFGMAVMATALVGCSSNDNLNPNPNDNAGKAGTAYAKFTIQLPTVSGTRADDDPTPGTPSFEGGTANEYAVNDAQLLIFEKTPTSSSEGDYTFVETVPIGNLEPWNNQNSQGVTRYADITAKLENVDLNDSGDKYYALFILNNEGETKVTLPTEGTYSAWNKANHAKSAADFLKRDKGFYMANAPKYVAGDEPTTLVPIKGVYSTKAEAQNKPATTVYVERGMAKVTIGSSTFDAEKPVTTSTNYDGDLVTITNWTLDVLNKTTFPVHKTDGLKTILNQTWATRFFDNTSTEFKRVYWGVDPNYDLGLTDIADCKDQFYLVDPSGATYNGETSSSVTWSTKDQPLYCLENTFDINNMKQGQTTRVLFKATYTPAAVASQKDKTFFMIGNNPKIWTKTTLEQQISSKVNDLLNSTSASVTINADAALLKAGSHKIAAADITITGADATSLKYDELNTKLGLDNTPGIKTYENGECYYIARIKHFNELTHWETGKPTYGGDNASYLGRYGVLRNNWYDLTVSKVSAPGYPDVPEVNPKDPDDEDTKFINVEVKILDWAKRSQSVDL